MEIGRAGARPSRHGSIDALCFEFGSTRNNLPFESRERFVLAPNGIPLPGRVEHQLDLILKRSS